MRETLAASLARLGRRRAVRPVVRVFATQLTGHGRALLVFLLVTAIFGVTSLGAPIYRMWAFASATLLAVSVSSYLALPRLGVRRRPVAGTTAGDELVVEIEVQNRSRRPAREVTALELDLPEHVARAPGEPAPLPFLAAGEKAAIALRLRCAKRGAYVLRRAAAASAFPLGFFRALRPSRAETSFLVYPAFQTPASFPVPAGRNHQPGGFLLSSSVGESSEFMNTREYRNGDNPRHVHWASSARLGRPVVKVYHEEYFVRLALVLDSEVVPGTGDSAFEAGVSIAAGIADYLSRREYIIDLFAAGAQVYHFQAGRALAHFEHILQILACLEATPRVDFAALAVAVVPQAARLTGVVAVLMDWSPERERFVEELRAQGVGVQVLVVRDRPTSSPPPALPPEEFQLLAPGERPAGGPGGAPWER